jgi:hypothetical protein
MSQADPDERKKKINNFRIEAHKWERNSRYLSKAHLIFGIAAILFSVTVASKPPIFGTILIFSLIWHTFQRWQRRY